MGILTYTVLAAVNGPDKPWQVIETVTDPERADWLVADFASAGVPARIEKAGGVVKNHPAAVAMAMRTQGTVRFKDFPINNRAARRSAKRKR